MSSSRDELANRLNLNEGPDINAIRQTVVSDKFQRSVGKRVILLQESFPFLFIGKIKGVEGDFLELKVEITNINELDGERFRIHLDSVQVFFIEEGHHVIPDIRG